MCFSSATWDKNSRLQCAYKATWRTSTTTKPQTQNYSLYISWVNSKSYKYLLLLIKSNFKFGMKWLYPKLAKYTQHMKHFEDYADKEFNIIQNSSKPPKEVDF